ncbi:MULTISPECIES: MarR family winged helix-turn-helix transcriptional regulator [Microbacterium]|uniref:MarR family winged helix-turn-helix transcriptional regulator n=1 Tax=Microbacterium TaxID=33882 RepID=UPI0008335DDC|nr:MarR family transcriptional regulator [Microbacterium resistens]MBW1638963.1 MarR family transcriptional regulator [Microbacterium resistens]MDA4894722.1 MarR family transcriptional regulator [Streptomyces sp. MS2A]
MSDPAADERTEALHALEAEFGELFSRVRRLYLAGAERVAPGLSPGAYKMFSLIARRGEMTASELAERTLSDKSLVSRMVRELEGQGLIRRIPDPRDKRSSLLSATPEGLDRLTAARRHDDERLVRALEDWELADIRQLTRLLRALSQGDVPSAD